MGWVGRGEGRSRERHQAKSSQVANPRNAFCTEQRVTENSKEARVRVFGRAMYVEKCRAGYEE